MHIWKATKCLKDVTLKKQCVPCHRYNSGVGRCAQVSGAGCRVTGPKRVLRFYCTCSKMQRAMLDSGFRCRFSGRWAHPGEQTPKMQSRTYRADGQINPYMSSPCHVEMILTLDFHKPEEEVAQNKKISQKKLKQQKLMTRGINATKKQMQIKV